MNKERLRKLAQYLDKMAPEKFDMRQWCNTPCCISGHANILFKRGTRATVDTAKYLGMDERQGEGLFWPSRFISEDTDEQPTPKQAAKVIRHLIKTGKVEWGRFVP